MKYSAKTILLSLMLFPLIFSCDNLLSSSESIETSDDLYRIELFYFLEYNNSSVLNTSSYAIIDEEEKTITVTIPPDVEPDSQNLTATIYAVNEADSQDDYWATVSRTWADNSTLEVTRNLIDNNWDGTSLYETEYTIIYERRLIPHWDVKPDRIVSYYPYNVFYSAPVELTLSFNGDINTTTLSLDDFTGSFYSPYNDYYVSTDEYTSLEDFAALTLSYPEDSQSEIILSLTEPYEGYYEITLPAETCESTNSDYSDYTNEATSTFTFLYDESDPEFVYSDSITIDDTNSCLTADEYFTLDAYLPLADDTMAGQDNLSYKIIYSTSQPDTEEDAATLMGYDTYLPVDVDSDGYADEWTTYVNCYSWSYYDLPDDLLASLGEGQSFYVNVIVMDPSGRCIMGNWTEIPCE